MILGPHSEEHAVQDRILQEVPEKTEFATWPTWPVMILGEKQQQGVVNGPSTRDFEHQVQVFVGDKYR